MRELLDCHGTGLGNLRCGDDDLSIDQMLVKGRVLPFLVRGGDELMALVLDPFPQPELVLGAAQKLWLLSGVFVRLLAGISKRVMRALHIRSCREDGSVFASQASRKGCNSVSR